MKKILIMCLLCLSACEKSPVSEQDNMYVTIHEAVKIEPAKTIYYGNLRGRYESALSFQTSGKVLKRNVNPGSIADKNKILLALDDKDIKESNIAAKASLEQAKAQMKLVEADYSRSKHMYESNTISKASYENSVGRYENAKATLIKAQTQYQQSLNTIKYITLKCVYDCVINDVKVEIGQVVAAGQTIVTVASINDLDMVIAVPENKINDFYVGREADIKFWALPELKLKGIVRDVAAVADPQAGTYKVWITVPYANKLKLGMSASAEFKEQAVSGVSIPSNALYQQDIKPAVWLYKNGKVNKTEVSVINYTNNNVHVTGINKGDPVVTSGIYKLIDGQQVKVQQ